MAINGSTITFVGNLTEDPQVRENTNGGSRTTFRVAVNEWRGKDNEEKTTFVGVTAFRSLGVNLAKSLKKGQRVIVVGTLDGYTKDVQVNGEDVSLGMISFTADHVGPDLTFQEADVRKGANNQGANSGGQSNGGGQKAAAPAAAKAPAAANDADDFV